MRTQQQIDAVLNRVQSLLDDQKRTTGVDLRVPPDGFVDDDPWLSVLVTPAGSGVRASQYVESLDDVEKALRRAGVDHVLLVPALVD